MSEISWPEKVVPAKGKFGARQSASFMIRGSLREAAQAVLADAPEPLVPAAPRLGRVTVGNAADVFRDEPPVRLPAAEAVARPRRRAEFRRTRLVAPHRMADALVLPAALALVAQRVPVYTTVDKRFAMKRTNECASCPANTHRTWTGRR